MHLIVINRPRTPSFPNDLVSTEYTKFSEVRTSGPFLDPPMYPLCISNQCVNEKRWRLANDNPFILPTAI